MSAANSNVTDVIIGNTFTNPASGDINTNALSAGQIIGFDNNRDGAITAADKYFKFAQYDSDINARLSLPIYLDQIKRVKKVAYAAATRQKTTIAVSSTDVDDQTLYSLFVIEKSDPEYVHKPRKRYEYVSDSSGTINEITRGLRDNINADLNSNWKAVLLSSEAGTAIGGAETLTLTHGSTTVVSTGSSHALIAGNYLRIGTAVTDPVYEVVSVNGATIVIDTPYLGVSASTVAAEEVPGAADVFTLQLWGDLVTGQLSDAESDDSDVIFDISLQDGFSTASTVTAVGTADKGTGTYKIVRSIEEFAKGYKGNMNRSEYVKDFTRYADATKTYVTYVVEHKQPIEDQANNFTKGVTVYTYIFLDSTATTSIGHLDDLFTSDIAGLQTEGF